MKKCMCCMRDYSESEEKCPFCGYSEIERQQDMEDYPEALAAETILAGRFILGRILSITDFSVIYLSWDALLRRRVAIREFYPLGLGERDRTTGQICFHSQQEKLLFDQGAALFEAEGKRLNENQDIEGILHVFRLIHENNTVYMVMEYLEGVTLRDVMDENRVETEDQIRKLVMGIRMITDLCHDRGIVHYNLCPENIFIEQSGQIRLIDFSDSKREVYRLLNRNAQILDPRYAAPEVLSSRSAGAKADLYSIGAIWYRLETGREPPHSRFARKGGEGLSVTTSSDSRQIELLTKQNPDLRVYETV